MMAARAFTLTTMIVRSLWKSLALTSDHYYHHPRPSTSYNWSNSFYPHTFPPVPYTQHNSNPVSPTEQMLSSLVESQSKVVKIVVDVSKWLGHLENIVKSKGTDSVSPASLWSSPDENIWLPPQLSVSWVYTLSMHKLIPHSYTCAFSTCMYMYIYVQKTVARILDALDDHEQFRPNIGFVCVNCKHMHVYYTCSP